MGESGTSYVIDIVCDAPTLARFHASHADVQVILGPVGSGKSWAVCQKVYLKAMNMPPCKDGVRRSAVAFIRDTATNLRDTTLVTWLRMVREDKTGKIRGLSWVTREPNINVHLNYDHPSGDGTTVDLMIYFRYQGCPDDRENLKSLDLTDIYFNEVNNVPRECVEMGIGRTGRYPDLRDLGVDPATGKPYACEFRTFMDSNMPNEKHWLWEKYLDPPDGWEFFRQPPAYFYEGRGKDGKRKYVPNFGQKAAQGIPAAENINHLGEGWKYYAKQLRMMKHEAAMVLVCAQPGHDISGEPVYGNYNPEVNFTKAELKFDVGKTLFIGFDWGLWPTAVLAQMNGDGQLQALEVIDGDSEKMGISQLWENRLRPKLINDYLWQNGAQIFAIGDPASGASQVDMSNCAEFLASKGLPVIPCQTNSPSERIDAVDHFIRGTVWGGRPMLVIGPKAYKLHEGMCGYYHLQTKQTPSGTVFSEVPAKDQWSHCQDAFQYICHAIKNPSLYNIEWRNRNGMTEDLSVGGGCVVHNADVGAAGVV